MFVPVVGQNFLPQIWMIVMELVEEQLIKQYSIKKHQSYLYFKHNIGAQN